MKKINPLVKWWLAPFFPEKHIENIFNYRPQSLYAKTRNWWRTFVVHPIRRRVAKYYLSFLRNNYGLKVVAITGSAGKTTTKEMLASILKIRGKTVYSYANIDPIFNIPTTILKCSPKTKYLVLEFGVEFPGEMDFYLWLAKPDVGVITNIFPTHVEFFGDRQGVFTEKSKLVKSLDSESFAVLNGEDNLLKTLNGKIKPMVIWYGDGAEVSSSSVKINNDFKTEFSLQFDKKTSKKIELPLIGEQFISNALAASAAAKALGITEITIKNGLEKMDVPPHRMSIIKHKSGAIIFDDSYNNNPEAAKASLDIFSQVSGNKKKIVVFGDMLELGNLENKYHREIGEFVVKRNIKPTEFICIGTAAKITAKAARKVLGEKHVYYFQNWSTALETFKKFLRKDSMILVKGSRSVGLENLLSAL